jgi:hypothetical protein
VALEILKIELASSLNLVQTSLDYFALRPDLTPFSSTRPLLEVQPYGRYKDITI